MVVNNETMKTITAGCSKVSVKLKQQHPVYIFKVSGLVNAVTEIMLMISIGPVY